MVNIEPFGNKDRDDLTTPEHDALVLMLLDKEYVKSKIIPGYCTDVVITDIFSEYPLVGYNGFNLGFLDILIKTYWDGANLDSPQIGYHETDYYIECKPKIFSFGDTLRQLNKYRDFVQRRGIGDRQATRVFILFTPDTTFKPQFESQGYVVITP